jgi:hypothetical protein
VLPELISVSFSQFCSGQTPFFDAACAIGVAKTQQRPPKGAISTAGACLPVEPTFS